MNGPSIDQGTKGSSVLRAGAYPKWSDTTESSDLIMTVISPNGTFSSPGGPVIAPRSRRRFGRRGLAAERDVITPDEAKRRRLWIVAAWVMLAAGIAGSVVGG